MKWDMRSPRLLLHIRFRHVTINADDDSLGHVLIHAPLVASLDEMSPKRSTLSTGGPWLTSLDPRRSGSSVVDTTMPALAVTTRW